MKFGIYAPNPNVAVGSPEVTQAIGEAMHPLPAGRRDAQYDHALNLLLTADALGFDLTLFAERHLGNDIGAWIMAASIGSRFEHMRVLTAVHPGLWDPVMIAKLAVSLDRICKGRMAINIVNGNRDQELRMFGGSVLEGEARYDRATEFIEILRGVWGAGPFSLHGKHYRLEDAELLLKPATPAPPEIYSVSTSDLGCEFIAKTCDWWFIEFPRGTSNSDETVRAIESSIKDMDRRASRHGRKVRYALNPFLALGDSVEDAVDGALRQIEAENSMKDAEALRRGKKGMVAATRGGCMGPPEVVRRQVKRYEDMGIELLLFKTVASVPNISRIAEEIIAPLRHS